MSFRTRSEDTAKAIFGALSVEPSDAQSKEIVAIVERAVVETAVEANRNCTSVAHQCCSADRDLAHKIADEIDRAHKALIANLSAMR